LEIYVSHGSVATQLKNGGIFNNYFVSNCLHYVPVKNVENRLIFGEDMESGAVGRFWDTV